MKQGNLGREQSLDGNAVLENSNGNQENLKITIKSSELGRGAGASPNSRGQAKISKTNFPNGSS